MATTITLEMDFATELSKTHRMRVYNAKSDLTSSQINTAMDSIISENIFNTSGGELVSKLEARLITKETEEFVLV